MWKLIISTQIKLKAILPHMPHKFQVYTSNDFRKIVHNKDSHHSDMGWPFKIFACVVTFTPS
jgi:hypothetical protein